MSEQMKKAPTSIQGTVVDTKLGAVVRLVSSAEGAALIGGQFDGIVHVWSCRESILRFRSLNTTYERIYSIALNPRDGNVIAIAGDARVELRRINEANAFAMLPGMADEEFHTVTFSPDGRFLLVGSSAECVRVYDIEHSRTVFELEAGERNTAIDFHPDETTFVLTSCSQGGSEIQVCRLGPVGDIELLETVPRDVDALSPASFSASGKLVAFADRDVNLWNFDPLGPVCAFSYAGQRSEAILENETLDAYWSNVVFGRNGENIYCGAPGGQVYEWSVADRALAAVGLGHTDAVFALEFHPIRDELLTTGYDGTLRRWEIPANLPRSTRL